MAKGCVQSYGTDFNKTYSPVTRFFTIRIPICLVLRLDMTIEHLDVSIAFLNGDLEEEGWLNQMDLSMKKIKFVV